MPTTKLANTPITKAKLNSKASKLKITAAKIMGVDNKKEYFAALSRSTPNALATVIVMPERDTPGNAAAMACEIPIKIACSKDMFS